MSSRDSSPSYPIFLYEHFTWFKMKALKEGRTYDVAYFDQVLETFMKSRFTEKNLMFDIYLHEMAFPLD